MKECGARTWESPHPSRIRGRGRPGLHHSRLRLPLQVKPFFHIPTTHPLSISKSNLRVSFQFVASLHHCQRSPQASQHKLKGQDAPEGPRRCLGWGWGRFWKISQRDGICLVLTWLSATSRILEPQSDPGCPCPQSAPGPIYSPGLRSCGWTLTSGRT